MSRRIDESLFGEAVQRAEVAAYLATDAGVIAVNDAVTDLTGYTRDEIFSNLVPPVAADEATRRVGEEVRAGRRFSGEARIKHKDGSVLSVRFLVSQTQVARDRLTLGFLWADA
jgi:PAS domain S-box-containing protein